MSGHTISTGIPGIFYRRPSPSEAYFVEEGDSIQLGQQVGMVEIMKSFHPILADVAGTVSKVLVEDAAEVAPGQALVEINTEGK